MKHVQLFEAYSLDYAKDLTKKWKESGSHSQYDELFGKGVDRIYLPMPAIPDEERRNVVLSLTSRLIIKAITRFGYEVLDYGDGTAKKVGDDKNIFKIGKVLQRHAPDMKAAFDSDSSREGAKVLQRSLSICISRHAYDIGGMSTGRGWTSCMNLEDGSNCAYVQSDIVKGTLVAYLINTADKNIKNPISRLLIKPYTKEIRGEAHTILSVDNRIYGTPLDTFKAELDKWADSVNKNPKFGVYKLDQNLYDDGKNRVVHEPAGYEIDQSFKNGLMVLKNNETSHYRLIDSDGEVLSGEDDYAAIIQVEIHPQLSKLKDCYKYESLFFYAKEGNLNGKYKFDKERQIEIWDENAYSLVKGNLIDDHDLLHDYLLVSKRASTSLFDDTKLFIDAKSRVITEIAQSAHTLSWSLYESTKGFFLVDKTERVTYIIGEIGVRVAKLNTMFEITPSHLVVNFLSDHKVLLSVKDGKVTTIEVSEVYNFDHEAPAILRLDEDVYDKDMFAVAWEGGIKKFSLNFHDPETITLIDRGGVNDIILGLDNGEFYSVRRNEFMFGDLDYIRYENRPQQAFVVLKKGSSRGLVNIFTGEVLLPVDKKYVGMSLAGLRIKQLIELADNNEDIMEVSVDTGTKIVTMLVDERGKMTPKTDVDVKRDEFPHVKILPMPF